MKELKKFIHIPENWDENKDKRYVEERYGPSDDHSDHALEQVIIAYAHFQAVLDHAFAYDFDGYRAPNSIGSVFTAQEKIDMLARSMLNSLPVPHGIDRLLEDLAVCGWVDHERHRLMDARFHPFHVVWGAELCDLATTLTEAALQLERSLIGAYRDYDQELVFFKPQGQTHCCSPGLQKSQRDTPSNRA